MKKNIVILYVIGIVAIILSLLSFFKYGKNTSSETPDLIAKEIVLKEENGIIKWKYNTESNWNDLYNLVGLKGTDGKDGSNGTDGKDGKNGTNGKNGKDGKDGTDGDDGAQGLQGETGATGAQGPQGETGPQGPAGQDGREIELRANGSVIQWKYTDSSTWTDLIDVSDISGDDDTPDSIVVSVDGDTEDLGCYNKGTSCDIGTLFSIKVNDDTTLDFYVISSDEDTVTLIAASNVGNSEYNTVAWYSASSGINNYGPVTALSVLNSVTNGWTNISPLSSYNYTNTGEGYKKVKITNGEAVITDFEDNTTVIGGVTRARLLTYEEAYSLGCRVTASASNCPAWLYANLDAQYNSMTPYGYWLLTSYSNVNRVYNIRNTGVLANNAPSDATGRGIRPVIVIKKI